MTENEIVNEWIEEAVTQAQIKEARAILIRILRQRFPSVLTEGVQASINAQPSLDFLHDWIESALSAFTPEAFLAVLRR